MYADDTIIHVSNVNTTEVNQELNDVLVNVENWYKANKLVLNVNKSNTMLIGNTAGNESADDFSVYLNDNKLENVQCTKYLGVKVDNQLKFDPAGGDHPAESRPGAAIRRVRGARRTRRAGGRLHVDRGRHRAQSRRGAGGVARQAVPRHCADRATV